MNNENERLQHFVLSLIFFFYAACMAVNTVQAISGKAELARHHFIPFTVVSYAYLFSVPRESYRRLWAVTRTIVVAVARGMLALLMTLKALPAMFVRVLISNYQEA